MNEVNNLLNRLGELDDAPLIWVNKKVYDMVEEIERLNNIINELEKWLYKKEKLTFNSWNKGIHEVQRKLQELKGSGKE